MEPQFQTSFIPKQHLAKQLGTSSPRRRLYFGGIGTLIASTIFFLTLIGAGVLFVLEATAQRRLEEALATLRKNQQLFEVDALSELIRLHDRYQVASELLTQHIAPSLLFKPLAERTLPTVQYTSFSFETDGSTVTLTMDARARDFASVALQSEAFAPRVGGPTLFYNPLVSNVKENPDGSVSFTLMVQMDRAAIAYRERAMREGATSDSTGGLLEGSGSDNQQGDGTGGGSFEELDKLLD